jgi:hypothetical protein
MKKIYSFIFLIITCLFLTTLNSNIVYADTTPAASVQSASGNALSPEQIAEMRRLISALSNNNNAEQRNKPEVNQQTVADVAMKALDMFGGAVTSLASNIEKVAPHFWYIMVRQQYSKAVENILIPFILILGTIIYFILTCKLWKITPEMPLFEKNGDITGKCVFRNVIPITLLAAFTIWIAIAIGQSAQYIINPEYYAVKDIMSLITVP